MSDGFRIPLAFDAAGKLVRPSPGLEGEHTCPNCAAGLVLRQGERVRPHFAHLPKSEVECSESDAICKIAKLLLQETIRSWLSGDSQPPKLEVHCAGTCRGYVSFQVSSECDTLLDLGNLVLTDACFDPVLEIQIGDGRVEHRGNRLVILDPDDVIESPMAWRAVALYGFDEIDPFCTECKRAAEARGRIPDPRRQDVSELLFGPGGIMVQRGKEYREGQLVMAQAVARAIQTNSHLMVEGPCGTGKSLAYLASAVTHGVATSRKVVVATSNIALQTQLIEQDLPFLKTALNCEFKFALLKGRGNYLCPLRYDDWLDEYKLAESPEHRSVKEWARQTKTGDQRELGFRPEFWNDICGLTDSCTECKETVGCFYQAAKDRARHADVVVANHSVLFAHLVVKRLSFRSTVLPPFRILVCDEGHELAEQARDFFGFELSETNLTGIAKFFNDLRKEQGRGARLVNAVQALFAKLRDEKRHITSPWLNGRAEAEVKEILEHLIVLEGLLADAVILSEGDTTPSRTAEKRLRTLRRSLARVSNAKAWLSRAATGECDPETGSPFAIWHETASGHSRWSAPVGKLCGKPVSVGEYLRTSLFAAHDSVIVTSATLTSDDSFDYLAQEIGFDGQTLAVPSPFNFDEQAMLVFPSQEEMPVDPGQATRDQFYREAARLIEDAITYSNGSALCLFTSFKGIQMVRQYMRPMPFKFLVQGGGATREALVEEFKRDPSSVLFGVDSFWTGVDVPGDALILLVVEKMPFPPPDDPLNEYWRRYYESGDEQGDGGYQVFKNHSVPRALIKLRQGVGRLIRTRTDYGVVLILDRRVLYKSYGSAARASLPFSDYKVGMAHVKEFFERVRQAKIGSMPAAPDLGFYEELDGGACTTGGNRRRHEP